MDWDIATSKPPIYVMSYHTLYLIGVYVSVCLGRRGDVQNLQLSEQAKQEVSAFSCL